MAEDPQPFVYTPIGELALVGKRSGVAQVYGFQFSGPLAWAMWRMVYWAKMPDARQRIRILLDWTLDVVFGRDPLNLPDRHALNDGQVPSAASAASPKPMRE